VPLGKIDGGGSQVSSDQSSEEYGQHLVEEVLSGRLSRRELLVRASVFGLSLSAVGSLLAACGGSSTSSAASPASSGTPQKGGTLVFAWNSEPASLDPAIAYNLIDWQICHDIFDSLYQFAPKPGIAGTKLEPGLAAAMPQLTNGGKTYTIPLKQGIRFQQPVNREVTAEDFKYSFERMMKLPLAPGTSFYTGVVGADAYMNGTAAHISGFKVVDPYTLEITLASPNLAFIDELSMYFCSPIPKEWVAKWGNREVSRHPLGTGPFMFDHWTPGQEIVLKRSPNYRDATHVWLDQLTYAMSINPETAFLRLKLGQVDVLGDMVPPADVVGIAQNPVWKKYVYSMPEVGTNYLSLNTQMKPLDNVKVRQAISWAIDRDKLVRLIAGQGKPLYQIYPPGMPGYQADKQWYGYDPAKAKALLAQAGYPNGFSTTLDTDNVDPDPKIMGSIQNDLAAVGIKAGVKTMANQTFWNERSTPKTLTISSFQWFMDFPDPVDWMTLFLKSGAVSGGENCSFWWSPTVEQLYKEAQASTDPTVRLAKYDEIQATIMDQAAWVTLYSPILTSMCSKNVGGFYTHWVYQFDPVHYWWL
jgi:oligopeptide transport system substrate-binding protein